MNRWQPLSHRSRPAHRRISFAGSGGGQSRVGPADLKGKTWGGAPARKVNPEASLTGIHRASDRRIPAVLRLGPQCASFSRPSAHVRQRPPLLKSLTSRATVERHRTRAVSWPMPGGQGVAGSHPGFAYAAVRFTRCRARLEASGWLTFAHAHRPQRPVSTASPSEHPRPLRTILDILAHPADVRQRGCSRWCSGWPGSRWTCLVPCPRVR